jgi:Novel STAND NTPase 1
MNPRVKRLATDWKTYTGIMTALVSALSAAPEFFEKLTKGTRAAGSIVTGIKNLPTEGRWIAAGILAVAAVATLLAAWSRKSILLRPERFVLSADEPQHLVGREGEIRDLAEECERHPLVFLQGESGAGKSSMIQAGLLPFYLAGGKESGPAGRRLLPVRIDASSLGWGDGLRIELTRSLRNLNETDRSQLGSAKPLESDAFTWLAGVPRDASRQLLIVLDQIDDYAVAHRQHFVRGNTVVSAETFAKSSEDWSALAGLVRDGKIHVLIVCRSDAAGILEALRFDRAATFLLPRIEPKLISPVLDHVTSDDGKGEVISDPDFGWRQLRERLLNDLSIGGTSVLPVQLAVALDSLRRFRFLTPMEYSKFGGLRGLERLHIERHVREAARAVGADEIALLRGLMCLVTEDGAKTRRAKVADFQAAVGLNNPGPNDLQPVISHLVRGRILREQKAEDGSYLLLHHDYLARGVREAYRKTNYWDELLRDGSREFFQAFGWRQRWRALLPISAQCRLVIARIRGRFRYAAYRRFAGLSTLRLAPLVAFSVPIFGAGWWADRMLQAQVAEQVLAGISADREISEAEAQKWIQLAGARDAARFHAVRFALSEDTMVAKVKTRAEIFGHAVVGLDPSGAFSRTVLQTSILPSLNPRSTNKTYLSAAALIPFLRLDQTECRKTAATLSERMKTEKDSSGLSSLGDALAALSPKLDPKEVQPGAAALLVRMKTETERSNLSGLCRALRMLGTRLDAKEVQSSAAVLVECMRTETNTTSLYFLAETLGTLTTNLDAKSAQPLIAPLLKRMAAAEDTGTLTALADALIALSDRLEAKDAQTAAVELLELFKTKEENSGFGHYGLGEVLSAVLARLQPKDTQPIAAKLKNWIETEKESSKLYRLARTLNPLSSRLDAKDVQSLAAALVTRMKTQEDSEGLSSLGDALGALSARLETKDAQPGAHALAVRMKTEKDSSSFANLGNALSELSGQLETKDVQSSAAVLVERMKTEADSYSLYRLGYALGVMSLKLKAKEIEPGAAALVERIKMETNSSSLSSLCYALGTLSTNLEAQDAEPFAAALVERMKTEKDTDDLSNLGKALSTLSTNLESNDAQSLATALVERMKSERDRHVLSPLSEALGSLSAKLQAQDAQRLATALVDRMKAEKDSNDLAPLSQALGSLSAKLETKDAQPLAAALLERLKTETAGLYSLGDALGSLSAKLEAKDVRPFGAALLERMKRDEDSYVLSCLGNAMAALGAKLELKDGQPGAIALIERMKREKEMSSLFRLSEAFCRLEPVANATMARHDRVQQYADLLKLPLVVEGVRIVLLRGVGKVVGEEFEDNIWRFMDWATQSKEGQALHLDLRSRAGR